MTPSVPAYVSETLYLGLRLKPVERIQTVQQLFRALSEREYAEELSRSMEALDPPAPAPQEPKAPAKAELLSVRNLLAGIVILLSVLILLTLWGLLSHQSEKPPEVIAPESVSEAASEPVNENVTLTPNFVGRDYDAEVRNNRSYIDEYLFYVTLEYSDTVEKGCIIRQSPEAGEVIQKGDTVSLVVSRGPQMMEMPDVIGQTQASAVQELATKGLNATCFTALRRRVASCQPARTPGAWWRWELPSCSISQAMSPPMPRRNRKRLRIPGRPPAGMPRRAAWNTIRIKQKEAVGFNLSVTAFAVPPPLGRGAVCEAD